MNLHPQVLKKNGKEAFVILPWDEYVTIRERLDDAEDLLDLREAKQEDMDAPSLTHEQVKKELGL